MTLSSHDRLRLKLRLTGIRKQLLNRLQALSGKLTYVRRMRQALRTRVNEIVMAFYPSFRTTYRGVAKVFPSEKIPCKA